MEAWTRGHFLPYQLAHIITEIENQFPSLTASPQEARRKLLLVTHPQLLFDYSGEALENRRLCRFPSSSTLLFVRIVPGSHHTPGVCLVEAVCETGVTATSAIYEDDVLSISLPFRVIKR